MRRYPIAAALVLLSAGASPADKDGIEVLPITFATHGEACSVTGLEQPKVVKTKKSENDILIFRAANKCDDPQDLKLYVITQHLTCTSVPVNFVPGTSYPLKKYEEVYLLCTVSYPAPPARPGEQERDFRLRKRERASEIVIDDVPAH